MIATGSFAREVLVFNQKRPLERRRTISAQSSRAFTRLANLYRRNRQPERAETAA
jgi:hypothetical protein